MSFLGPWVETSLDEDATITILSLRIYKHSQTYSNQPGQSHHPSSPGFCMKQTEPVAQSPLESPGSTGVVWRLLLFALMPGPLWELQFQAVYTQRGSHIIHEDTPARQLPLLLDLGAQHASTDTQQGHLSGPSPPGRP